MAKKQRSLWVSYSRAELIKTIRETVEKLATTDAELRKSRDETEYWKKNANYWTSLYTMSKNRYKKLPRLIRWWCGV